MEKKYFTSDDKELTAEEARDIQTLNGQIWQCVESGALDFKNLMYIEFLFGFTNED